MFDISIPWEVTYDNLLRAYHVKDPPGEMHQDDHFVSCIGLSILGVLRQGGKSCRFPSDTLLDSCLSVFMS